MIYVRVLKAGPFNSIKLHFLNQLLHTSKDIKRGQVVMGTEANKQLLIEDDLYHEEIEHAQPNDMIIVIDAADEAVIDTLLKNVEELMNQSRVKTTTMKDEKENIDLKLGDYLSKAEVKSPFFFRNFTSNRKMGRIHSIFKTSFNIVLDDKILNFSTKGMPVSPHGCILDKDKIDQILESGKTGDIVRVENNVVTFYTRKIIFKVDFSEIEEIDLTVPVILLPLEEIGQTVLFKQLEKIAFENHIGLKQDKTAQKCLEILRNVHDRTSEEIRQTIKYLIGRGAGLTPSGDDVLLGFTMIRRAFDAEDYFEKLLKERTLESNTTAISMAYYESLFAGYINSLFVGLISSIEKENINTIQSIIELVARYGHTSGYDTLFGVFLGLQSLLNEK